MKRFITREIMRILSLSLGLFVVGIIGLNVPLFLAGGPATGKALASAPPPENHTFAQPTLLVPGLEVQAPIVFSASSRDKDVLEDLRHGVSHLPGSATPDQKGNVFIQGHSSNYPWERGEFNHVFAFLNKLSLGDMAYIDYQGKRYEYRVVSKQVVAPSDVSVTAATNGYNLSLMTCYPTGTALKRLVVFFDLKQVDE